LHCTHPCMGHVDITNISRPKRCILREGFHRLFVSAGKTIQCDRRE
jgi:hypothetical protein